MYDDWAAENRAANEYRKRAVEWDGIEEEDIGDSCCFGTRTVRTADIGSDCVWRLHGGI